MYKCTCVDKPHKSKNTHIYIYTYITQNLHIDTSIDIVYIRMYVHMYIHFCTYMYVYQCVHMYIHACVLTYYEILAYMQELHYQILLHASLFCTLAFIGGGRLPRPRLCPASGWLAGARAGPRASVTAASSAPGLQLHNLSCCLHICVFTYICVHVYICTCKRSYGHINEGICIYVYVCIGCLF